MDRYTKVVLTVIAINLTLTTLSEGMKRAVPDAWAATATPVRVTGGYLDVHVSGGRLDYETDVTGGPTLKVCTQC
jgi:hypothetical protein